MRKLLIRKSFFLEKWKLGEMSNFEVIEEVVYLSGEDETEVMVFVFSVSRV